jgi:DNA (cytosine-5)-methyltransferase 1
MLTIGSLFSGIGGIELGLERAGLGPVIWQAECDPYCLRVLEKHWPDVRRYTDVREIDETTERPDLICGGFPCQPFSSVGKRLGEADERNMWPETIRCIRLLGPRYVLLENVPALLANEYMGQILGDLAARGFDIEWDCIPASALGAPFEGDRLFICATNGQRRKDQGGIDVWPKPEPGGWWLSEPRLRRVVDGVSSTVGSGGGNIETACLANAVVPQVAQWIGERIKESLDE